MTYIYHTYDLVEHAPKSSSTHGWGTLIAAAFILAVVLSGPHFSGVAAGDIPQLQQPYGGAIEFDGRGKWTGYM